MKRALLIVATFFAGSTLGCSLDWKYYEVTNNTDQHLLSATSTHDCERVRLSDGIFEWFIIDPGESLRLPTVASSECVAIAGLDQDLIFADAFSPDRVFTVTPELNVEASEYTDYNPTSLPRLLLFLSLIVLGLAIIGGITVIRWVFLLIGRIARPHSGARTDARPATDEIV